MAHALAHTPPADVTADQLLTWAASKDWAPETRHSYYVSIHAFYTALDVDPDPSTALPSIACPVPPPHPTPEQIYRTALDRADDRTHAILILAGSAGLRRSEIVQVSTHDLITEPDGAASLLVRAKGGRDRSVPLAPELAALIRTRTRTWPLKTPPPTTLTLLIGALPPHTRGEPPGSHRMAPEVDGSVKPPTEGIHKDTDGPDQASAGVEKRAHPPGRSLVPTDSDVLATRLGHGPHLLPDLSSSPARTLGVPGEGAGEGIIRLTAPGP